jgi:hypothetical protein
LKVRKGKGREGKKREWKRSFKKRPVPFPPFLPCSLSVCMYSSTVTSHSQGTRIPEAISVV